MDKLHVNYQDTFGELYLTDLELPNVRSAPKCPYNLISIDMIWYHNIFVDSRHYILYKPGFSDQNPIAEYRTNVGSK